MFVSLKNIIPKAIEKHGLRKHIGALTEKEKIEKTISAVLRREVRVIKHHGRKVVVRGEGFAVANELRLRQEEIRKKLEKENIYIDAIQHSL